MKLIIKQNEQEVSNVALELIKKQLLSNPKSVLGLATGSTYINVYKQLVGCCKKGEISFKKVVSFNLDEYIGLDAGNTNSYRYFMNDNLFNHIDIDIKNTFVPSGTAKDPQKECLEYDRKISAAGGIDLQLLGLGNNAHIGFNEPADDFAVATHVVDLTDETISANKRFFDSVQDIPTKAITMGIGSIMASRKIILSAMGPNKAKAIKQTVQGPVTPSVPASILRFHPDVVVIVDEQAASLLD